MQQQKHTSYSHQHCELTTSTTNYVENPPLTFKKLNFSDNNRCLTLNLPRPYITQTAIQNICFGGVFTTRWYRNPHLPLSLLIKMHFHQKVQHFHQKVHIFRKKIMKSWTSFSFKTLQRCVHCKVQNRFIIA